MTVLDAVNNTASENETMQALGYTRQPDILSAFNELRRCLKNANGVTGIPDKFEDVGDAVAFLLSAALFVLGI